MKKLWSYIWGDTFQGALVMGALLILLYLMGEGVWSFVEWMHTQPSLFSAGNLSL